MGPAWLAWTPFWQPQPQRVRDYDDPDKYDFDEKVWANLRAMDAVSQEHPHDRAGPRQGRDPSPPCRPPPSRTRDQQQRRRLSSDTTMSPGQALVTILYHAPSCPSHNKRDFWFREEDSRTGRRPGTTVRLTPRSHVTAKGHYHRFP